MKICNLLAAIAVAVSQSDEVNGSHFIQGGISMIDKDPNGNPSITINGVRNGPEWLSDLVDGADMTGKHGKDGRELKPEKSSKKKIVKRGKKNKKDSGSSCISKLQDTKGQSIKAITSLVEKSFKADTEKDLFVQTAKMCELTRMGNGIEGALKLVANDISSTFVFSDTPIRKDFIRSTSQFVSEFSTSFPSGDPNAAITFLSANDDAFEGPLVAILSKPKLTETGGISYNLLQSKDQNGTLSSESFFTNSDTVMFTDCSIFIDDAFTATIDAVKAVVDVKACNGVAAAVKSVLPSSLELDGGIAVDAAKEKCLTKAEPTPNTPNNGKVCTAICGKGEEYFQDVEIFLKQLQTDLTKFVNFTNSTILVDVTELNKQVDIANTTVADLLKAADANVDLRKVRLAKATQAVKDLEEAESEDEEKAAVDAAKVEADEAAKATDAGKSRTSLQFF